MKTGEVVAGRFRLVRVAGTGGMGAVWEAVDEQTGARVALKVVPIEGARGHGQQARARFALEARALAELRHPNVVRYLWHGVVGSSGLVAMEWLDGRDLAGVLAGGALPPEVVLEIALGLSRALAEAHARGVVHRDVKPSNVWVSRPEGPIRAADVKLLDFGLAALRPDDETIEGPAAGTARYMAPEQARGEAPDARADYFSLGCVLYECLTGRPAFDADRTLAVLADVQSEDVPRPGARRAGLSPEIDRLVTSLLARDPADRPRGSAEVAALLGAAVGRRSPAATAGLRWVPVILGEEVGAGAPERGLSLGEGRWALVGAVGRPPGDSAKSLSAEGLELARRRPRAALWLGLARLAEGEASGASGDELAALASDALVDAVPGRVLVAASVAPLLGVEAPLAREAGRAWLDPVAVPREESAEELVGRDAELRLLVGTLEQCETEGVGRTVLVTGPPGIGVSALVREGLARGAPADRWARRGARAPEGLRVGDTGGSPEPLGALWAVTVALAGAEPVDAFLSRALAGPDDALARAALLSLGGPASADVAPIPRESGRFSALAERGLAGLVEAARRDGSEARPLVVTLDDAHLADPASRAVLRGARRALAGAPVTWVLCGRSEVETVWSDTAREEEVLTIRLGPLRPRAAERLALSVLTRRGEGSPELARRIAQRAEGHPLVVVELARLGPAGASSDEIPTAVQALVEARFAALDERARLVLCAVASLGQRVEAELVAHATEVPRSELDLVVDELVRAGLLERVAGGGERERSLAVAQALVRDVARAALVPQAHAALLSRAAHALEAEPPSTTRSAEALERAAAALVEAGDPSRAAVLFARAAGRHAAAGRPLGAERAAVHGLRVGAPGGSAPDGPNTLQLLGWLADAIVATRRGRPDLAELLAPWIEAAAPEERARACAMAARAIGASGRPAPAWALLARGADEARDDAARADVLAATVEVGVWAGEFERAVAASEALDALDAERSLATLLKESLARAARMDGAGALRVLDKARSRVSPNDLGARAELAKFESLAHLFLREPEATARLARAGAELARAAGLVAQEAINLHNEGDALHRMGRLEESRAVLERSTCAADAAEHPTLGEQNRLHLAYLDARGGSREAEATLREGVARLEAAGRWGDVVDARVLLVRLLAGRGDPDAEGEGRRLLTLAREKGQLLAVADVEEVLGAPGTLPA